MYSTFEPMLTVKRFKVLRVENTETKYINNTRQDQGHTTVTLFVNEHKISLFPNIFTNI